MTTLPYLFVLFFWKISCLGSNSSDTRCVELTKVSVIATTSSFSIATYALSSFLLGIKLRAFVIHLWFYTGGGKWLSGEIEEVFRLEKYEEGKHRPLKIRFRSQVAAEGMVLKSWELAKTEEEAKERQVWGGKKYNKRSDKQSYQEEWCKIRGRKKEIFFWKVIDMDLRKWYIRVGVTV